MHSSKPAAPPTVSTSPATGPSPGSHDIMLSSNPVDFTDVGRPGFGWMNALMSQPVVDLVRQTGFRPDSVGRHGTTEILVPAFDPSFTRLRRLRRHVARIVDARPNTPGSLT